MGRAPLFALTAVVLAHTHLLSVYAISCNVTTYGAVGDNSTDDTAAIQARWRVSLLFRFRFVFWAGWWWTWWSPGGGLQRCPPWRRHPGHLEPNIFVFTCIVRVGLVAVGRWGGLCNRGPRVCQIATFCGNVHVQKAISDASCSSVVINAPGAYLTRPLDLASLSNRNLVLQSGAQLVLWRDPDTYSPQKAML